MVLTNTKGVQTPALNSTQVDRLLEQIDQPSTPEARRALADSFSVTSRQANPVDAARLTAAAQALYGQKDLPSTKAGGAAGAMLQAANFNAPVQARSSDFFQEGLSRVEQWLYWETNASFKEVRRPYQQIDMSIVHAPKSEVGKRSVPASLLPEGVESTFEAAGHIAWPQHPNNTVDKISLPNGDSIPIPYAKSQKGEQWKAWHTASRSMIVKSPSTDQLFSVKLPTNFPTPHMEAQHKANLVNHTVIAVRRGAHILESNSRGAKHPELVLQPDVAAYFDKASENGFTIRDITSFLDNENYYMPGFALPQYGEQFGLDANEFMNETIAPMWGRNKALLLLRYGLYLKSPHGQNTVFQLDKDKKLTGQVTLRDLSDTSFVGPVAEALGYTKQVQDDKQGGYTVIDELKKDWSISVPGLDHTKYFNYSDMMMAEQSHYKAFIDTVRDELGKVAPDFSNKVGQCQDLDQLQGLLFSDEGRSALGKYGKQELGL